MSAAPLAFVAEAGTGSEAEATIDVRCAGDTSVSLSLDKGMNAAGAQRRLMSESGTAVPYAIYTDPARTRRWEGEPLSTDTPVRPRAVFDPTLDTRRRARPSRLRAA